MLRDAAVQRIQEGLGFRTDLETTVIARLQEEQRDLERGKTLPRFLLKEGEVLSLASGTNLVTLPTDFLRRSDSPLLYIPVGSESARIIPWKEYEAARDSYSNFSPAGPAVAALRSSSIYFFPTADLSYDITWDYYQKAEVLSSNIENLWLANAPELLIGGAGLRTARDIRNDKAVAVFGEMYKQARMTWFSETIVQEEESYVMGGNN